MSIPSTTRLDYRVRQPLKPTANPQLLFLLHGYGSHEEDLFSFANYLPEDYLIISLRAPLSLSFGDMLGTPFTSMKIKTNGAMMKKQKQPKK